MLTEYLKARYVDGGRGEVVSGIRQYDCWGLAEAVRQELLGLPKLPEFGVISRHDLKGSAVSYRCYASYLAEGPPRPGSIAAVIRGQLCTHVGVVLEIEGRLAVLETNEATGVRWMRIPDFERTYPKVRYHVDRDL